MQTNLDAWDLRILGWAAHIARSSKDPSTQAGCFITDSRHRTLGTGFNGFPVGVEDTKERLEDRELKLALTQHAERNALAFATGPVEGGTAYIWPIPPCSQCAGALIQEGIRRIVAPELPSSHLRWKDDVELGWEMFQEAGVIVDLEDVTDRVQIFPPDGIEGAAVLLKQAMQRYKTHAGEGCTLWHRKSGAHAAKLAKLTAKWSELTW